MSSRVAVADTYHDVERLIYTVVSRFWREYGGDFQELLAEANYRFLHAYAKYIPTRGDFDDWVAWRIRKNLMDLRRKELKCYQREGRPIESEESIRQNDSFDLSTFLRDLSEDASQAVRLALSINQRGPATIRKMLRQQLRSLGWSPNRINSVFTEIAEHL